MNFTTSHIEQEKVEIEYRTLYFGINTYITLSPTQAEELFNVLDKELHKDVYTDMEDRCLSLESDLEKSNELIEELEDRVQEDCCQVN